MDLACTMIPPVNILSAASTISVLLAVSRFERRQTRHAALSLTSMSTLLQPANSSDSGENHNWRERRRASCEFGGLIARLRSYTLQNAGGHDGMLVVLVVQDWHYIWVVPVMAIDKKHISVSIDSSRDLAWRVEDGGSVLRRRF